MIYLKSIEINTFKGISNLICDFNDITVLTGLNNSGKTTVLQAVYLLMGALSRVAEHPNFDNPNVQSRTISLRNALSPLGLRDNEWLSSIHKPEIRGTISGVFENGLKLELGVINGTGDSFTFTTSDQSSETSSHTTRELIDGVAKLTAAFLTPPGEVPSREDMVNCDSYQSYLRQGKGAQYWRNDIWWGIQTDGFESFEPVRSKIAKYFPDIELLQPTLGKASPPEILIKYKEQGRGPLDIAQSGAGLRTFLSLTRILDQSSAKVLLLDEPDAHLHASQQAIILDLMTDAALRLERQVIISSHSPEIITRVPPETTRWIERNSPTAQGGEEIERLLERLGATPDIYIPRANLPERLVYVEGIKDRSIIESLVKWCRNNANVALPSTMVVPHRDGRFEGPTLHGIAQVVKGCSSRTKIVGVRDLDWYYSELPSAEVEINEGDGWILITLPCKEMENILCSPEFLYQAYERKVPMQQINLIVDEESNNEELLQEWRYQVCHRIRNRLDSSLDPSTKDKKADEIFDSWTSDPLIRRRLVAGKKLLSLVKNRIRQENNSIFYPPHVFNNRSPLSSQLLLMIAEQIFPEIRLDSQS